MPIIYDIETISTADILSGDGIFMLDTSDTTMSSLGSNKTKVAESFQEKIPTEENVKFFNLNISPTIEEDLTLEIFKTDGSKFAFTDSLGYSKLVSTSSGIFLTESEISKVSADIDSLSFLSIFNNEYSFQRALNPIHLEGNRSSLICSNLSSLQASLINLGYQNSKNFLTQESESNTKINNFFNEASSSKPNFHIENLFPAESLSDIDPGERFSEDSGVIVENINGYVNENYNYLVSVLAQSLNTTQYFVNLEIAKKIKNGTYISNCFENSNFVVSFINEFSSSVDASIVGSNYQIFLNLSSDIKKSSLGAFDFSTQAQADFMLSQSSRENIFSTFSASSPQLIGYTQDGVPIITRSWSDLSDSADIKHITVDGFSEESFNQNYSLIGSNREKGFYLSEDERFEIIYGISGSSPSVDSISFDQNSQEYLVTLANIDGGYSYQIEFDNIANSTYNTSGTITGIKTDSQTLPISNNFEITPLNTGANQSISFKLLESKSANLNDPESSSPFSFGDIKFLRSDKNIGANEYPSWILRSSDVRKNFQAGVSPSIQQISGENYFVMSIDNTAGLVFDIEGATFNFQFEPIETSIRGSDETVIRKFKLSETPYNFFRISSFFSEEKDLFYNALETADNISPLGLNSGWVNLSDNTSENIVIVPSGTEYTGAISKSGFSILFEYNNLTPGENYIKQLPEFVEFESDPNVYLINGNDVILERSIMSNGISFIPEYSSYTAAVPYSISGEILSGLAIDDTQTLAFSGDAATFQSSDITLKIQEGTTTTQMVFADFLTLENNSFLNQEDGYRTILNQTF